MTKGMEKNFKRVSDESKEQVLNARKFMMETVKKEGGSTGNLI
jgi:hypothetical protein